MTALRPALPHPPPQPFLTETYNEELDIKELTWINAGGGEMGMDDWEATRSASA